jgi:hypothetical protein
MSDHIEEDTPTPAVDDSKPHFLATWKDAVTRLVNHHGVEIVPTQSGHALVRRVGTMVLSFPLPIGFHPDKLDSLGPLSPDVAWNIGRVLDVKLYYPVI